MRKATIPRTTIMMKPIPKPALSFDFSENKETGFQKNSRTCTEDDWLHAIAVRCTTVQPIIKRFPVCMEES